MQSLLSVKFLLNKYRVTYSLGTQRYPALPWLLNVTPAVFLHFFLQGMANFLQIEKKILNVFLEKSKFLREKFFRRNLFRLSQNSFNSF